MTSRHQSPSTSIDSFCTAYSQSSGIKSQGSSIDKVPSEKDSLTSVPSRKESTSRKESSPIAATQNGDNIWSKVLSNIERVVVYSAWGDQINETADTADTDTKHTDLNTDKGNDTRANAHEPVPIISNSDFTKGDAEEEEESSTNAGGQQQDQDPQMPPYPKKWTRPVDFVILSMCLTVSMADLLWFPKMWLDPTFGGPETLFMYYILLFVVGVPLFSLECYMSQYTGRGVALCWEFARLFQGLGYSMLISTAFICIHYNITVGWALHYLFASWERSLPWASCYEPSYDRHDLRLNSWNLENCLDFTHADTRPAHFDRNHTFDWHEISGYQYFYRKVMGVDYNSPGHVQGDIVCYILLSMFLVALALMASIRNLALLPTVISFFLVINTIALFIRGVTLDGGIEGLAHLLKTPTWDKMSNLLMWRQAAIRVFVTLDLSTGCVHTLASRNKFEYNFLRSTLIVVMGNFISSIFFAIIVAAYIGAFAAHIGVSLDDLEKDYIGNDVLFIHVPMAISDISHTSNAQARYWSSSVYFLVICLGLSTQIVLVKTVADGVADMLPRKSYNTWKIVLVVCLATFLLSIPFCTPLGFTYSVHFEVNTFTWMPLFSFFEVVAVAYFQGADALIENKKTMGGYGVFLESKWYIATVKGCTMISLPVILLALTISNIYEQNRIIISSLEPVWLSKFDHLVRAAMICPTFVVPLVLFLRDKVSFKKRMSKLITPTANWRPYEQDLAKRMRRASTNTESVINSMYTD